MTGQDEAGIEQIDPHDEIVRLEARIEELEAKIENCRKFILASRAAVAVGGLLFLAILVGAIRSDAVTMTTAIIAAIGGLVLMGSNRSTAEEASVQLASVEDRRDELINFIELQVVSDRDAATVH